jgi:hypothetical protein
LLEDVNWWERPLAGRQVSEPIAGQPGVKRPLQIKQRLEWINESRNHARTPLRWRGGCPRRWTSEPVSATFRFGLSAGTVKGEVPKFLRWLILLGGNEYSHLDPIDSLLNTVGQIAQIFSRDFDD